MNWFLYVGRVRFEWAKHGQRCQRNTIQINVLYFILRSFEFIRFRISYYVFKVVLRMLSKYDQKTSGILYFWIVLFWILHYFANIFLINQSTDLQCKITGFLLNHRQIQIGSKILLINWGVVHPSKLGSCNHLSAAGTPSVNWKL